jgi:hypothetical protein
MRSDAQGLFWHDERKEKYIPTPPPRDWEAPDYLPHWEEASTFAPDWFDEHSLTAAMIARETLIVDVEVFPNYFSVAFKSYESGKVALLELTPGGRLNTGLLLWLMQNFLTVGFNSNSFDITMIAAALTGADNEQLLAARNKLIIENMQGWLVLRSFKTRRPRDWNHIDVIEVAPLSESLKTYAGRLHCRQMADLPFHPDAWLTGHQMVVVRWYNVNDLDNTALLYKQLQPQIELRKQISALQGVDVRSKSDAQIAEAVIENKLRAYGYSGGRPEVEPGREIYYKPPKFLQYQSATMQWTLHRVCNAKFVVEPSGYVRLPQELESLSLPINGGLYRMGMGGLHSSEQTISHYAKDGYVIRDRDVASFYPRIILNCKLYPEHLGPVFLEVYRDEVEQRLRDKKSGNKVGAESRKIVINGCFGKLGNAYSIFYSPDLLMQVTITGQLSLLMLIERLELAGIPVVSANTDGVVSRFHESQSATFEAVIKQWEMDTGFETEEAVYRSLHCRDVNNYIAVKEEDGKLSCKFKGVYSAKGSAPPGELSKNPQNQIVNDAVEQFLLKGTAVEETIFACQDIKRFVCVRKVKGGGYKGRYLGKVVRWYYGIGDTEPIIYAESGNKVPDTDGAAPCMLLPDSVPADLDRGWYIREAQAALVAIGAALPNPVND